MLSFSRGTKGHTINSDGAFYSASFDKIEEKDFDYSMQIK
jgi:hypothetical protein